MNNNESEYFSYQMNFEKTGDSAVREAIRNNRARATKEIRNHLHRSGPVVSMMLRRARQRGTKTKESGSCG